MFLLDLLFPRPEVLELLTIPPPFNCALSTPRRENWFFTSAVAVSHKRMHVGMEVVLQDVEIIFLAHVTASCLRACGISLSCSSFAKSGIADD